MSDEPIIIGRPGAVEWIPPEVSDAQGSTTDEYAFDRGHFRTVLGHFPTGVTIITGMHDQPHGFTIGSFTSVSLDPPMVGFLPQTDSMTWRFIEKASSFCVNVLSHEQSDLCWKFAKSGTEVSRFEGVSWHPAPSGAPVIDRAVAWIDCTVERIYEMGDHYFVLGRVEALDANADRDGLAPQPLVFYRGTLGGFASEG